jgi:hypothetical protein
MQRRFAARALLSGGALASSATRGQCSVINFPPPPSTMMEQGKAYWKEQLKGKSVEELEQEFFETSQFFKHIGNNMRYVPQVYVPPPPSVPVYTRSFPEVKDAHDDHHH